MKIKKSQLERILAEEITNILLERDGRIDLTNLMPDREDPPPARPVDADIPGAQFGQSGETGLRTQGIPGDEDQYYTMQTKTPYDHVTSDPSTHYSADLGYTPARGAETSPSAAAGPTVDDLAQGRAFGQGALESQREYEQQVMDQADYQRSMAGEMEAADLAQGTAARRGLPVPGEVGYSAESLAGEIEDSPDIVRGAETMAADIEAGRYDVSDEEAISPYRQFRDELLTPRTALERVSDPGQEGDVAASAGAARDALTTLVPVVGRALTVYDDTGDPADFWKTAAIDGTLESALALATLGAYKFGAAPARRLLSNLPPGMQQQANDFRRAMTRQRELPQFQMRRGAIEAPGPRRSPRPVSPDDIQLGGAAARPGTLRRGEGPLPGIDPQTGKSINIRSDQEMAQILGRQEDLIRKGRQDTPEFQDLNNLINDQKRNLALARQAETGAPPAGTAPGTPRTSPRVAEFTPASPPSPEELVLRKNLEQFPESDRAVGWQRQLDALESSRTPGRPPAEFPDAQPPAIEGVPPAPPRRVPPPPDPEAVDRARAARGSADAPRPEPPTPPPVRPPDETLAALTPEQQVLVLQARNDGLERGMELARQGNAPGATPETRTRAQKALRAVRNTLLATVGVPMGFGAAGVGADVITYLLDLEDGLAYGDARYNIVPFGGETTLLGLTLSPESAPPEGETPGAGVDPTQAAATAIEVDLYREHDGFTAPGLTDNERERIERAGGTREPIAIYRTPQGADAQIRNQVRNEAPTEAPQNRDQMSVSFYDARTRREIGIQEHIDASRVRLTNQESRYGDLVRDQRGHWFLLRRGGTTTGGGGAPLPSGWSFVNYNNLPDDDGSEPGFGSGSITRARAEEVRNQRAARVDTVNESTQRKGRNILLEMIEKEMNRGNLLQDMISQEIDKFF